MGNIAENLRNLRKKRSMTQEELAGFLHISFQTVSKWERQESYPDISMLPVLGRFFGVSVDELLGVDEETAKEEQEKILRKWEEDNAAGKNLENIQRMRAAVKQFPGNYEMMLKLVTSLEKCHGTLEEIQAYRDEAIELSERIIRHCPDAGIRNDVMYNICYSYWNNGNKERAVERAKQLPRLYKSQENALVMFLHGEEQIAAGQNAVVALTSLLYHHISCLCREDYYTLDEKLEAMERYLHISGQLFEKEDVQEILHCRAKAYVKTADIYVQKQAFSKACASLRCAAEEIAKSERIEEKDAQSDGAEQTLDSCQIKKAAKSLLSNAIAPKGILSAGYKKNWLLQQLESDRFAELRTCQEFIELHAQFTHFHSFANT